MISVKKGDEPEILVQNSAVWLEEWLADKGNHTKRYRYRHPDIRDALREETYNKCVYCESQIGIVHPGETEHKIPSSKNESKHFDWGNLTRACTECNRRKNAFYDANDGFIDPYDDDVESMLEHHGPMVFWKTVDPKAEVAVRLLELNSRVPLLLAKKDELMNLKDAICRYEAEQNPVLKEVLRLALVERAGPSSKYSAMIKTILKLNGII